MMKTSNHPDPRAREMFNKLYAEQARIAAEISLMVAASSNKWPRIGELPIIGK